MKSKIYCWNARGEIYLNPVFILMMQVSWGAQRQIFARAGGTSCSQHCHISVLSTREAILTTTCAPPITTEHFATIGSGCRGARARSAVVTASVLLELPPGELSASLTAFTRIYTLARAYLMKWAQLPQNKGEVG